MARWTVAVEPVPDDAIRQAIASPLIAHNMAQAGDGAFATVAVTVRDAAGQIAGGLWGHAWHGFLFVELLALGEARGFGLARKVMALAEAEARRLGCVGIWLDTFTFQAPWFYPRLGFVEFGRIAGHPAGHDRIFLIKHFDPPTLPCV